MYQIIDQAYLDDMAGIGAIMSPRRAHGTLSHQRFCRDVLEPVFGAPDVYGNYCLRVGRTPTTAFMAHHDTVEFRGGMNALHMDNNGVLRLHPKKDRKAACLGADCGAGIWLILEMIRHAVPGVYCIFSEEEVGCIGSRAFADSAYGQDLLAGVTKAVSFDRHNKKGPQVITHMSVGRTCSDAFAGDLCLRLGMDFRPDPGGSITDSMVFVDTIAEVTNISVGYTGHHTAKEALDTRFLRALRDRLITVDWDSLPVDNSPRTYWSPVVGGGNGGGYESLLALVLRDPEGVAAVLESNGLTEWDVESLIRDLDGNGYF